MIYMYTKDYFDTPEWQQYEQLRSERPDAFKDDPHLMICSDQHRILDFMNRTGRKIGVVYKSPFSLMVVDLVEDLSANLFAYERLLPAVTGSAVVTIPKLDDRYVLLNQFRHALRQMQLAFPRGFGEERLSALENAEKEIKEETGAASVTDLRLLGHITPDSGEMGTCVSIVSCCIDKINLNKNYEGIDRILLVTEDELREMIAHGRITDGYTLAAWALLRTLA